MEYTRLGRTGLKVSRLCLGTMTFGYQCEEELSIAIMDRAFDGGVTFFDTADAYPIGANERHGRTEEIVGRWLTGRRHDVILATKCFAAMSDRRWDAGNSRKHILDAVDASLRRLNTDYIDLYQLHQYDRDTPIEESLRALEDVVRAGKVRYAGCSNFLAYQLARALGKSEAMGVVRMDCVQPRYNLLFRQVERELLPLCLEEGVGVISYNPLAGGLLTGKHRPETGPAEGSRFTLGTASPLYQARYWHDREFETVERILPLAAAAGMSPATMATAWVMSNPAVTAPIIGASRPEQLDDTLAAAETTLPVELKAQLDDLTHEYRWGDAPR